jgi:hypothetical protein
MAIRVLPSRPGVYISTQSAGNPAISTALFQRTYLLGTSTQGTLEPFQLGSYEDFINFFGNSEAVTKNTINTYLQNTKLGLFFVKVPVAYTSEVTLSVFGVGTVYGVTVGDVVFTVTAVTGDTITTIVDNFVELINNSYSINNEVMAHHIKDGAGVNDYSTRKFVVRSINGEEFTISSSSGTATAPSTVTINYWDYVGAAQRIVNSYKTDPLGFLVCPEAFYNLDSLYQRNIVANSMEVAARNLGWMTFLDAGSPDIVSRPSQLTAEFENVGSPQGHSAAYYPWLIDTNGNHISLAAMTAGYALQRFEKEGIQHPPAGNSYPFVNISSVAFKLSDPQRDFLADIRVNPCIFRRGYGFVPYDVKTLSLNTDFRFINHRVILSCIERTVFDTIENSNVAFKANSGGGAFYLTLRNIIIDILDAFYRAGALYGLTYRDAYDCRCDATVQTPEALERGVLTALIYAVPATTVRQVDAVIYRVKIGGIPQAILQTL